jgi:DNA-binding NarL/FixJ family response regulator
VSIRVLIADDQALVRTGFRMILSAEPDIEVVGEAADGAQAVEMAGSLRPDVVLMDIRMPDMDGIEATRRVVSLRGPDAPRVLMLTTFDLDEYLYDALRAGASGFLLKDVPAHQLASGVRMIAAGDALLAPSITRRLVEEFSSTRRTAHRVGRVDPSRARGVQAGGAGTLQCRDRRRADRRRDNRQDTCRPGPDEAGSARSRSGRGPRL